MGQTILTPEQQLLLGRIVSSSEITNNFYLTGGTALSEFYFRHRLSEDFDLFSEHALIEKDILSWVKNTAKDLKIENVEYKTLNGQQNFKWRNLVCSNGGSLVASKNKNFQKSFLVQY
jgi:hypothetical protein